MRTASSADVSSTSVNSTAAPTSPSRRSMRRRSPGATRYCFPPVRMTAYDIQDQGSRRACRAKGWSVLEGQRGVNRTPHIPMIRLTLYGRAECHLCHEMEVVVAGVLAERGRAGRVALETVDVDSDPALAARFGDRVP